MKKLNEFMKLEVTRFDGKTMDIELVMINKIGFLPKLKFMLKFLFSKKITAWHCNINNIEVSEPKKDENKSRNFYEIRKKILTFASIAPKDINFGKAVFDGAEIHLPELTKDLKYGEFDCHYDDSKVDVFLDKLKELYYNQSN